MLREREPQLQNLVGPKPNIRTSEALLKELVNIDSQTMCVSGVNLVQSILSDELSHLGFKSRFIRHGKFDGSVGRLLVSEFEGRSSQFITLVSHADTVLGPSLPSRFVRGVNSDIAFGSGVIDNKGGLVVAIESLRSYLTNMRERNLEPEFSLRLVSSPSEEAGSEGFHENFREFANDSILILGFEPALENGSIIKSRRGNRWYDLRVQGVSAHSGRCKGEEINAAHELALKIADLHSLNEPDRGMNVNVGHVQGGIDRFNVVCGSASAKIDARFSSFESRDELHSKIDRILTKSYLKSTSSGQPSRCTYTLADDCPPFSPTKFSERVIEFLVQEISKREGRVILSEQAGGAGDVNHMSREGLAVIDGLGPVGGGMHTTSEFVYLSTIATRSQAVAMLLENASQLLSVATEGEAYDECTN